MLYDVLVTTDCTKSATIRVEAASVDDAERLAVEIARRGDAPWEDDDNDYNPYIADPGSCAEEVDGGDA